MSVTADVTGMNVMGEIPSNHMGEQAPHMDSVGVKQKEKI